jgi:hypothetical protein
MKQFRSEVAHREGSSDQAKGCRAQNRAADLDAIGGAPERRGMANILATATFSIRAKSDKRLKRLIG